MYCLQEFASFFGEREVDVAVTCFIVLQGHIQELYFDWSIWFDFRMYGFGRSSEDWFEYNETCEE